MGDIPKGIESGLIETIVVSVLLLVQQMSGLAPEFTLITWLNWSVGMYDLPIMGWVLHFIIGAGLWGASFAAFSPHLYGPHWVRGSTFGCVTWFLMMTAFMSATDLPMFGMGMGLSIPVIALFYNLAFGLVMGETYHLLLHYVPSEVDENA